VHVPLNNSINVVLFLRLLPIPLTVIVAFDEVAVKTYHTSFVGLEAAQAPLGDPVLVASCKSPVIVEQVTDEYSGVALSHKSFVGCEKTSLGKENRKQITRVRSVGFVLI
jgi:hypothetical protein